MSPPSIYKCKMVKAKKEHTCYECKGIIEIEEYYVTHWGIWDGKHKTYKVCHDCNDLIDVINRDSAEFGEYVVPFGDLKEAVYSFGCKDCIEEFKTIKNERRHI